MAAADGKHQDDVHQQISSNIFVTGIQLLLPQPCYDEFLVNFNFFDVVCLKVFVSKCLGYGIILGSLLVKFPQILKILAAKSGAGISMLSLSMEIVAISSAVSYGWAKQFPFSAYGDGVFLGIQTTLIGLLILLYSGRNLAGFLFIAVIGSCMAFLMSPSAPIELLTALQASNMPIVAISKFLQIIANYRNSSTGQLSAVTLFLLFAGSTARIFTSIQETGDKLIILTYVVASCFNCILVIQLLYYWNSAGKNKKQKKKRN